MKYNFDEIIDRRNTDSLKVDGVSARWGRDDLIPMWVADMDFKTPPFILDAIRERCDQGILGYTLQTERYFNAIQNWIHKRYNWNISPDMIQFTPGVVSGLAYIIKSLTKPGDKILIQTPVYHPFFIYTEKNDRVPVFNPLILEEGHYKFNIPQFKELIKECKLFILCHPHNPGGRVWSKEELEEIAEICYEHQVPVISDEIHADLTLPGHIHTPFATISEKAKSNSITLMAASKAFNIPGLSSAYMITENKEFRKKLMDEISLCEGEKGHIFAFTAIEAAYGKGSEWLQQLTGYINENVNTLETFAKEYLPKIKVIRPQASYLVFLDCRELELPQQELVNFFVEDAHLALNDGSVFGKEGIGFMRMNVGCPRIILQKALNNLKNAYDKRFTEK